MPRSRLRMLREWRVMVSRAVEAIRKVYPDAKVYLVGGAAEDRLTVASDIDVAVVFNRELSREERVEVLARIWEELEESGVPPYYPLHVIVLGRGEVERLRGAKKRLA